MARSAKWLANQIKRSEKELAADVDTDTERAQLDRMAKLHSDQVEELKTNPGMALARISSQKVYFTAEELHLAYGRSLKSKVMAGEKITAESLTEYDDVKATNTDEEFWETVAQVEGHWTKK